MRKNMQYFEYLSLLTRFCLTSMAISPFILRSTSVASVSSVALTAPSNEFSIGTIPHQSHPYLLGI